MPLQHSLDDEVLLLKMEIEDLNRRVVALEHWVGLHEGEIKEILGRVGELERR